MGFSRNFWILSFAMFFFMLSFNLVMPELNAFITKLGGADYKGFIIALFTIAAGLARPFSGKLADTIGRKRVMYVGLVVCILASLSYIWVSAVWVFLFLRFFHGFSTGFFPTGATAMTTDILPPDRRGEGMGIFGAFMSIGLGAGQSISSPIASYWGIEIMFSLSAFSALISSVLLIFVHETLDNKIKFQGRLLLVKKHEIIDPLVKPVAITMFLSAYCTGVILVLVPDLSEFLGIENKGVFFMYYVVFTIVMRLGFGKVSDIRGRREILLLAMIILLGSVIVLAMAENYLIFAIAAILFGIASGLSSPSLFAWTADLSDPENKGRGAGTMFIALEFGIMFGSLSTFIIYDNTMETLQYCLYVAALMVGLSIAYLQYLKGKY
jgi:MFS family permease